MEDASAVDLDWFWRGWFYTTDQCDQTLEQVKWFKLRNEEADPEQKKPIPLLMWTEQRLSKLLNHALSENGIGRVDQDALSTLFIMAYDGFVINRRLNDLRDIERLSDAMCDILLGPAAR